MSFPFKKCYNIEELKGYGITVSYDHLGNTQFLYKNVEIGYLLDIPGEGFEIATSFKINDCDYYLLTDKFEVEPIYKRMRTWRRDETGKTYLEKEKLLRWEDTTLSEVDFHEQLLARLIRAIEIYEAKLPILMEKFPWIVNHKKHNMTDEECIEHNFKLDEGNAKLLNGNDIVAYKFKTEYKKLTASTNVDITYWLVSVKTPVVTGIIDGQETLEYTMVRYFVRHDRFGGNKILMKLNSEDFMTLQGLIM